MHALGPGRLSAVSCGRCAGRAGSRGLTSQRGAPGAGRGAGGAPGASRGGVVSESVAKAPRAGIGGEEKRGISTFLFQCSGPVRAFATDSDKRRRRGPLCGRRPPAPGLQHQGPSARAPARTAVAALAPTPGPTRPDPPGAETCTSRSGGRLRPPLSRATCASRRAQGRPGSAQAPRRQPDRTVLELSGAPPGRGHDPHPSADSDPPPHPGRSAQRTVVTDSRRISEAGTRCEAGRPPSIVSQIISTARAAWRSGCWVMTVSRGSRRLKTSRSS